MEHSFFQTTGDVHLQLPELREVSAGFHTDSLSVFLWTLPPLIQEDFGPEHVHQLIVLADDLKFNEARRVNYRVTYRGRRLDFRIILYRYQMDAIGFYLKGPWSLAHEVQGRIESFEAAKKK
jgi:hypothetical protein